MKQRIAIIKEDWRGFYAISEVIMLKPPTGCGDMGCIIEKPPQGTNGGCRCDKHKLDCYIQYLQSMVKKSIKIIDECINKPQGVIPDSVYEYKNNLTNRLS
jgi:hypothetical protein